MKYFEQTNPMNRLPRKNQSIVLFLFFFVSTSFLGFSNGVNPNSEFCEAEGGMNIMCDDIWPVDSARTNFLGNTTPYCVQVSFASLSNYDIEFQGQPLTNPFTCFLNDKVEYDYGLLPGGGFTGPYTMQSWVVNGIEYSGVFNDPQEFADLLNSIDPNGFWQVNSIDNTVFGGYFTTSYNEMEVIGLLGPPITLQANPLPVQNGFTVQLSDPNTHLLVAIDPLNNCADTLFLVPDFDLPETETIHVTTTVNVPTDEFCVDGEELPLGFIANLGYCSEPSNGAAPLMNDSCFTYIPDLNFAGQDTFCVLACDDGFPQYCDSTIFIVNVLPEIDTVHLNIAPNQTSIDTCLDNFIIELPGPIDQSTVCGVNPTEISVQINGNCLEISLVGNFVGTSELCVEFCSGSVCDINVFFITVEPPIVCEELFPVNPEFIFSVTDQGFYCIPVPTSNIGGYDVFLDGNLYTDSYPPCNFSDLIKYDYSSIVNGPFELNSWTINGGPSFNGDFDTIQELVDSMNVWDVAGNWEVNLSSLSIIGGDSDSDYSNLTITPMGMGQQTLIVEEINLPLGSLLEINGFGIHQIKTEDTDGCTDELTLIFDQHFVTPETLHFETFINTQVPAICGNSNELLGSLAEISICEFPTNGSVSISSDSCIIYTPSLDFIGSDEFCFVLCDDFTPQVCDTFTAVVNTSLPLDTVVIVATNVVPFEECLDGTVLQLPGILNDVFICASNPSEVDLAFQANCVTIDLANDFVGTTTACVVHCNLAVPPVCDTTILEISFDGVFPCDPIFVPDEVTVLLENNEGEVCLPIPPGAILNYDILLDGATYTGTQFGCDIDLIYTYFYGSVPGQGNVGVYEVEWTANGTFFAGSFSSIQELVDLMNGWDPTGNWMLNPAIFSIQGSNDSNVYGDLLITNNSGIETLIPEPILNPIPFGTQIVFSGAGPHVLVLEETGAGCSDTLFINAINPADAVMVTTLENTPSPDECIDVSGLPGSFIEMTLCDNPSNGTLIITDNCFTYLPNLGFIGQDTACVEICDNTGFCDQTSVFITVNPLCGQYQFFPNDIQEVEVNDCVDIAAYCLPILLDSIPNFGVLDNGFPYGGGFVPCNINLAQMALDTGFHEVIFVHLASGCSDTLFVDVFCEDDNSGCGFAPIGAEDFCLNDCSLTAEFCLDIPVFDIPNLLVMDNGAPFSGVIDECTTMALMTGIQLDTGFHELVVEDTVKGCTDTFTVNVQCVNILDVTQILSIPVGEEMEVCLSEFNYPINEIDSIVNICPGQSDGESVYSYDPLSSCLMFSGLMEGSDIYCLEVYAGCTSATITVIVTIVEPCPDYFPNDEIFGATSCGASSGQVCLPLTESDLENLEISVNGVLHTDELQPCGLDSTLAIALNEFPGQGVFPPYQIDEWTVNGIVFMGTINTAEELADSMNVWDPNGNWQVKVDPITMAVTIEGGAVANVYGDMIVSQTVVGITETVELFWKEIYTGLTLELPLGNSILEFVDTVTLCSETVVAEIICVDTEVLNETIEVGLSDTICIETDDLLGSIVSLENVCPDNSGQVIQFTISDSCVVFTGLEPGSETGCFVVCDELGICDTTIINVVATIGNDSTLVAVDDEVVTGQGEVIVIDVFQNDTINSLIDFFILDEPNFGEVVFLPSGGVNYVPNQGYCDDLIPDEFTYVICNFSACDTATVSVTVRCSELELFNAFSPNGDGINDFFKITGLQNFPNHKLYVFNRWGNQVFEATNYQSDWFGTWEGNDLPDGTYFYLLDLGNGEDPLDGYVQLQR